MAKAKKSGAQRRKEARAKEVAELKGRLAQLGAASGPSRQPSSAAADGPSNQPRFLDPSAEVFAKLGEPPLDEPELGMAWARRAQMTAVWAMMSLELTDELRERVRWVKDFCATMGMTQNRAELEQIADRLEGSLANARGTAAIDMRPVEGSRPPTSRGGGRGRGPLPI